MLGMFFVHREIMSTIYPSSKGNRLVKKVSSWLTKS